MCQFPITLKDDSRKVPCGKCPKCTKAKLRAWLFRLDYELDISLNPLFVTLTYDEQNVPYTRCGQKTLNKRDCQLFLKRLRRAYSKKFPHFKLKYFLVGEYGSLSKRPHYHLILLNLTIPDLIASAWQYGFSYYPPVKDGAIKYVLKYISKGRNHKKSDPRQREFSTVSV